FHHRGTEGTEPGRQISPCPPCLCGELRCHCSTPVHRRRFRLASVAPLQYVISPRRQRGHGAMWAKLNRITESIIGAAIQVHRAVGPGLLESAYEECLCRELSLREVPFLRQVA